MIWLLGLLIWIGAGVIIALPLCKALRRMDQDHKPTTKDKQKPTWPEGQTFLR